MDTEYFIKRTLQSVFTFVVVVSLSYWLFHLLPGDPASFMRAQLAQRQGGTGANMGSTIETYTNLHPSKPVWQQFVDYVASVLQGDLGVSIYFQEPVTQILAEALPWTVFLMATSLFFTFTIGIGLGALMAYREGSRFDLGMTLGSIFSSSIPYFIAAILFVYIFGYQLSWFPTSGRMSQATTVGFNIPFLIGVLHHAALPVASLVLTGIGAQAITMRGNSIRVLGDDYIRVARLRGLSEQRIAIKYVAHNAILPMYTNLMIGIGGMLGGAVILEQIFGYPGVGYYLFQALSTRDYPLMMGGFILITTAVIFGIYFADLTYSRIDPRAGGGDREAY